MWDRRVGAVSAREGGRVLREGTALAEGTPESTEEATVLTPRQRLSQAATGVAMKGRARARVWSLRRLVSAGAHSRLGRSRL